MGAHISAHTSLGVHTSRHTSPHMRLGAHTSPHMSAHTSAHMSACMCAFLPQEPMFAEFQKKNNFKLDGQKLINTSHGLGFH